MKKYNLFCFILYKAVTDIGGVLSFHDHNYKEEHHQRQSSSSSIFLRKRPHVVHHPGNHNIIVTNDKNGRALFKRRSANDLKNNDGISSFSLDYRGGGADNGMLSSTDSSSSSSSPRDSASTTMTAPTKIMKGVMLLNASSKWWLASANLYGVIRYRDPGAFLCLGCILAFFATEHLLKPLWNQARPHGAPLADPGMPSSHALGSFFVAIGWAHVILRDTMEEFHCGDPTRLFLGIATMVASLRILCGYHTIAQVVVGALLGLALGHGWMDLVWNQLGIKTYLYAHVTVRWIMWSAYITGSVFFIWKAMSKWIDHRFLLH